jgi:hypothetical protein
MEFISTTCFNLELRKNGKHTDLEVVDVRQGVRDSGDIRHSSKDNLAHLVHSGLNTGAVVLGESFEGGVAGTLPGGVELAGVGLDIREAAEAAPLPASINAGAQDTVPGLLESGVLVTEEAVELGAGALENGKAVDGGVDINALALHHVNLDIAGLAAFLDEGVGVRLAINVHAHPAVGDNVDVGSVDVTVLLDEVGSEDGAE